MSRNSIQQCQNINWKKRNDINFIIMIVINEIKIIVCGILKCEI